MTEHKFIQSGPDWIQCSCGDIFYDGDVDLDMFDTAKNKFLEHLEKNGKFRIALKYMDLLVK